MILQGQSDPASFDQRITAPVPDFFLGEFLVNDWPKIFHDIVGGQLGVTRNAPPGKENAEVF